MPSIFFFQEDTDFLLEEPEITQNWIEGIVLAEKFSIECLNYIFCSDAKLLEVNQQYLQHDTYTDIITFDNSDERGVIESDIFLSIDRVRDNASNLNADFNTELHRVMIHGVLHLIGYNDKSEEETKAMRKKEEACLSLLDLKE